MRRSYQKSHLLTIFLGQFVGQLEFFDVISAIFIVYDFEFARPFFFIGNGFRCYEAVVGFETMAERWFA